MLAARILSATYHPFAQTALSLSVATPSVPPANLDDTAGATASRPLRFLDPKTTIPHAAPHGDSRRSYDFDPTRPQSTHHIPRPRVAPRSPVNPRLCRSHQVLFFHRPRLRSFPRPRFRVDNLNYRDMRRPFLAILLPLRWFVSVYRIRRLLR